ncbi:SigE family RNA polymerase sigma factor [Nocardioides sp. zg-DK7169]|uniref:SigE family RNA polymerase sigma factor n=1 Tax=Nocardioides sp. zg-DK7169 TaxID=2736600 RepID=UPI0015524F9A|nr:SigE family RNA polymerase sigma factor [Nocardioides sp. zg-DK7169]NPC97744.1 SigE family RNA polymerase sigma factor [Nocardioides sp. zg-DK7169]
MTVEQRDRAEVAPDAEGFAAFVSARGPALQRFAFLLTGSAHDAADLVQEALASAWPRWSRLAQSETIEAYVRRSIVNASVSAWRKTRRQVSVAHPETLPRRERVADHAGPLGDADHAWRLCEGLPPQQRAAVVLRFYEDLPFRQVAEALGCPESTARSHVHRAVAALRLRLEEETDRA